MKHKQNIALTTYFAIAYLASRGVSQEVIAGKLALYNGNKLNRPYVRTRVRLCHMPQFVWDEYELLMVRGPQATRVRWSHVCRLYNQYQAEYEQYPEGGPVFRREWSSIIDPPLQWIGIEFLALGPSARVEEYDYIPVMASLLKNGFMSVHPLDVLEERNGCYVVQNGNRRLLALLMIWEANVVAFDRILPSGKIPCNVVCF